MMDGIDVMNKELDAVHALLKSKLRACRKLKAAWLEFKSLDSVTPVSPEEAPVINVVGERRRSFHNNGHKRLAVRPLTKLERDKIREEFLRVNGEITEDVAVSIRGMLSGDVSIFQVTGVIVGLHRRVRLGTLVVDDRSSYDTALVARKSVKYLARIGYPVRGSDVGRVSKYNQEG